mmetsp:Transcript_1324/g.3658  ORF Transcript_1324/g.3658 Transcript_1324/m.3658 type:complete len:146 (-) Transcript_1324:30-467(-)
MCLGSTSRARAFSAQKKKAHVPAQGAADPGAGAREHAWAARKRSVPERRAERRQGSHARREKKRFADGPERAVAKAPRRAHRTMANTRIADLCDCARGAPARAPQEDARLRCRQSSRRPKAAEGSQRSTVPGRARLWSRPVFARP